VSAQLTEYARQVREGLKVAHGTDPLAHCALGISAEAGEVADQVKKSQFPDGRLKQDKLFEELGDTLWYLTAIANQFGWSIVDIAIFNLIKLEGRYPERGYDAARMSEAGLLTTPGFDEAGQVKYDLR
jgi:NTP pyrophosphatase (non-canonical NTP hydrolase)